jgi:hypothetical protein
LAHDLDRNASPGEELNPVLGLADYPENSALHFLPLKQNAAVKDASFPSGSDNEHPPSLASAPWPFLS